MNPHRSIRGRVTGYARPLIRLFPQVILFCLVLWGGVFLSTQPAYATTYEVTNANDSGSNSLRQAILNANGNSGPDTITFGAGAIGTINLESSLPAIEDDLTITGPVVGVPPEVLDLDLTLTPLPRLTVSKEGNGEGTVTSQPAGILCGDFCSSSFEVGTEVVLTASPALDAEFAGWGGACSGKEECRVTMDEARSVTATFRLKEVIEPTQQKDMFLPTVIR